jgi:hypothetical protein
VKKHVMFVLMLLASIAVVAPIANAQRTKLTVPYDFMAAGRKLHAGTYTVTRQPVGPGSALFLKNIDKGEAAFLIPTTFESALSDSTTLRFEQVGELRILREIQTPTTFYTFGSESKAVKIALKQLAASSTGQ